MPYVNYNKNKLIFKKKNNTINKAKRWLFAQTRKHTHTQKKTGGQTKEEING